MEEGNSLRDIIKDAIRQFLLDSRNHDDGTLVAGEDMINEMAADLAGAVFGVVYGMKIEVYDNGGETFDRYTVVIGCNVYSMSANALSPQGVNQLALVLKERELVGWANLGKKLYDIPGTIKEAVAERCRDA